MVEKMKDSGIEWIGEIPEGWELSRLKYIFDFRIFRLRIFICERWGFPFDFEDRLLTN